MHEFEVDCVRSGYGGFVCGDGVLTLDLTIQAHENKCIFGLLNWMYSLHESHHEKHHA